MIKYTGSESIEVVTADEDSPIGRALAKTGSTAVSEMTDEEKAELEAELERYEGEGGNSSD